ncbi:MAG: hypothetical protein E3J64_08985, partial [Anaerolineales bacterium]
LEYKTEHVYMWAEEGLGLDRNALKAAADLFEEQTYPTNRAFFGSEWRPGVDNDPHLSILNAGGLGFSVLGYYSSADEFVSAVRDDSNEMEMFYINTDVTTINSYEYNATLAHEFQHMICWYQDRNEDTWLNEGMADLASALNGFDAEGHSFSFAIAPDNQLNDIDYDSGDALASYGSGFLFATYFLDRFGEEATQSLSAAEENGLDAVDAVLRDIAPTLSHEDIFADWVVANLLDDTTIADGQYGYYDWDPPRFHEEESHDEHDYAVSDNANVRQYGTDYIGLEADQPLRFRFEGATSVGLADTTAHSGLPSWYSNRSDDSDTMLAQYFDLGDVEEATLEYWTWYDIEEDWDYAYLEASTDGGETWAIVRTPSCTRKNPNMSSYGCAYTGSSGGSGAARWIREQVDLSRYAGGEVVLRFEYITDDAVNRPGFLVDDISIAEIGYSSDFETDGGGWEPAGFVRTANVLAQQWLVQLAIFGRETTVERLELSSDQSGEWIIALDSRADRAVIAISAVAPVTTERAPYYYEVDLQ